MSSSDHERKQPDGVTIERDGKTESYRLEDLSLDQLVQLSQGFGHQIDRLRQKRAYLKVKIDERLAMMERSGDEGRGPGRERLAKHLAELQIADRARGGNRRDGEAPGADLQAGVSST